jgi:Tubulin binding cofactor C
MLDLLSADGGSLAPGVLVAIREVFRRCDSDGDNGLNAEDLQHFARWCNAAKYDPKGAAPEGNAAAGKKEPPKEEKTDAEGAAGWEFSSQELSEVFDTFETHSDAAGATEKRLTLTGFEDLWHLQCGADPEAAAADLRALGFLVDPEMDYGGSAAGSGGDGHVPLPLVALVCSVSEGATGGDSGAGCWAAGKGGRRSCVIVEEDLHTGLAGASARPTAAPSRATTRGESAGLSVVAVDSPAELFAASGAFAPFPWQRVPILHEATPGAAVADDGADGPPPRWILSYGVMLGVGPGQWRLTCRERHSGSSTESSSSSLSSTETVTVTVTDTQSKIAAWRAAFRALSDAVNRDTAERELPAGDADADAATARLSGLLAEMRRLLAEKNPGITAHDLAASQKLCDRLAQDIPAARERWQPRKKFAFRRSRRGNNGGSGNGGGGGGGGGSSSRPEQPASAPASAPAPAPAPQVDTAAETVRDRSGETLDYISSQDPPRRFVGLRDCVVLAPPVAGSVYVENCAGCRFYLGSQQLRIHDTQDTDFMLFVKSGPIIEGCRAVRFGPYTLRFPDRDQRYTALGFDSADIEGGGSNLCREVNDFKWLKAQHSPNWSPLDSPDIKEL